jgi:hypothetical protein
LEDDVDDFGVGFIANDDGAEFDAFCTEMCALIACWDAVPADDPAWRELGVAPDATSHVESAPLSPKVIASYLDEDFLF